MKLDKFQKKAGELADYPAGPIKGLLQSLWVSEEGQEVMRCFRVSMNKQEPLDTDHLQEEMGDTLTSLAHLANEMGFSLGDIAKKALGKQENRYEERQEEKEDK